MKADAKSTAPAGADLFTPGDFLRESGKQLLAAHQALQAARELLVEWRLRVPDDEWARALPEEVRHD